MKLDMKNVRLWGGLVAGGLILGLAIGAGCSPSVEKSLEEQEKIHRQALETEQKKLVKTQQQSEKYKRQAEAMAETEEVSEPVILDDGTLALDGNGKAVFKTIRRAKTRTSSSASGSTDMQLALAEATVRISNLTEDVEKYRKQTEKPAVRRWTLRAAAEITTGRVWAGVGFNQDLRIFEIGIDLSNPVPVSLPPEFRPMVGVSIRTHKLLGLI